MRSGSPRGPSFPRPDLQEGEVGLIAELGGSLLWGVQGVSLAVLFNSRVISLQISVLFETGSPIAQAGLKFPVKLSMALNT